jgi:hypothetical protein
MHNPYDRIGVRVPSGGRRGWVVKYQHILVAEQVLGKSLPIGAEIHHVNGIKTDNRPSNLVICQDRAYHLLLHMRTRVLRAGGNPNTDRLCSKCKTLHSISEFYVRRTQASHHPPGTLTNVCRDCLRSNLRKRYAARYAAGLTARGTPRKINRKNCQQIETEMSNQTLELFP